MGGGGTKTVGGGQATPTANAFNQFLLGGLQNGTFGAPSGPNNPASAWNTGHGLPPGYNAANGTPGSQSSNQPGSFAGTINHFLTGGNPLSGTGGAVPFRETQFGQLGTNLDLSRFNSTGQGGVLSGLPDFQSLMSQGFGGGGAAGAGAHTDTGPIADFMGTNKQNFNYQAGSLLNASSSPELQALQAQQNRQKSLDVANLRARFGASGGGSLGSGAQFAEGNYLAAANPAQALAQGELMRQQQTMDLSQQGLNAQTRLGLLGAGSQDTLGRLGLTNQSQLGNRQISSNEAIATAGNMTSASIANAQTGLQGRNALLQYMLGRGQLDLGARSQDAGNMFNQFQANNQGIQGNNQNLFANNTGFNNYNLQNQGLMNAWGMGGAQLGQQGQLDMMRNLFGAFGQANQLGTPQAQTVQTPSMFSQIMSGLGSLGGLASGIGQMGGQNGFGWWGGSRGNTQGSPGFATGTGTGQPTGNGQLNPVNPWSLQPWNQSPQAMGGGFAAQNYMGMGQGGWQSGAMPTFNQG